MLYDAVCKLLKMPATKQLIDFLPIPSVSGCKITSTFDEKDLGRLIHLVYDIRRDDGLLRANLHYQGFDFLRKNYPPRREFSTMSVLSSSTCNEQLQHIGFNIKENKEEI